MLPRKHGLLGVPVVHPHDSLGGCEAKYVIVQCVWEYACPFDRGYMFSRGGGEDS